MKALGKDLREFYDTGWPAGYYEEETLETLDDSGKWILDDDKKYELKGFLVPESHNNWDTLDFAPVFRRWLEKRDIVTLLVSVPVAEKYQAIGAIRALGYKIAD